MEGLLSPRTSLRTLSEARFAQDGTGALLLERTTLFAEAQCTLGDRTGRLLARLDGRWAAFDYEGRQLTEFGAVEP